MRKAPAIAAFAPLVAVALLLPAAPADASRRCGKLQTHSWPGVQRIVAYDVGGCPNARRVARALQRTLNRDSPPDLDSTYIIRANRRYWRCRFREHYEDYYWVTARCRQVGHPRRHVKMRLTS